MCEIAWEHKESIKRVSSQDHQHKEHLGRKLKIKLNFSRSPLNVTVVREFSKNYWGYLKEITWG